MAFVKRYREHLILAALLVVGAALRLWGLGSAGLWRDEAQGFFIASKGFPGGIVAALAHDGHPPLYYFLAHFWALALGRGELATRLLPALCGLAGIPAVYALGRRLYGLPTASVAAGLATFLPLHVSLSRTARMYSLVALLATLTLYLAYEAGTKGGLRAHIGLALASVALIYTHNWGALIVVAVDAWWVLLLLIHSPARQTWRRWVATQVAIGLAYLPWLPLLQAQRAALVVAATWVETGTRLWNLVRLLNELTGLALPGSRPFLWLALAALGLLAVRIDRHEVQVALPLEPVTLLVVCTFTLPPVLGLIITPKSVGIIPNYVTIVIYPALCLVLARGVLALRRWWTTGLALLLVAALWQAPLRTAVTAVTSDLREVAAYVEAQAGPGDVIIVTPDYLATTFNFYYRGPQKQVAFPSPPGRVEEIIWANYGDRWAQAEAAIEPTLQYIRESLGPGGRVWLVGPVESYPDSPLFVQIRAFKARLETQYTLVRAVKSFRGPVEMADVYVYEPR